MGAGRRTVRNTAAMLTACALVMVVFPGHQAKAKGKSPKDQLKHALVGQVVTSRILLGNRARPNDVTRQDQTIDFPVHTLVDADTGEIAYRIEDPLLLEWAKVHPREMLRSFDAGTSFRISSIHLKDNWIEIKLKQLDGGSAEVKLMLGKGWQSRYDAAAVEAKLTRVFAFGQAAIWWRNKPDRKRSRSRRGSRPLRQSWPQPSRERRLAKRTCKVSRKAIAGLARFPCRWIQQPPQSSRNPQSSPSCGQLTWIATLLIR